MDDYLGGFDTKDNALRLRNSLIEVMLRGGFALRKWISNSSDLLTDMPNKENKSMTIMELENKMTKILGLLWCPERDIFKYKIEITTLNDLPQLLKEIYYHKSLHCSTRYRTCWSYVNTRKNINAEIMAIAMSLG